MEPSPTNEEVVVRPKAIQKRVPFGTKTTHFSAAPVVPAADRRDEPPAVAVY